MDSNAGRRTQRPPLIRQTESLRIRFGAALQRERDKRGITQGALAEYSGLSPKYVGEIERGEANVSIDLQERLCVALNWYPFELWVTREGNLPDGARAVLEATLKNIAQLAATGERAITAMTPQPISTKPKRGRPRGEPRPQQQEATASALPAGVDPNSFAPLSTLVERVSANRHEIASK